MTDYVLERERKLPVISHYDIVVVGAGIAGTAAALAASRHNKKVLLVERMYAIGGLATLGLITVYLPLCDGTGRQICFGLNDEFLKLAISRGYEDKYPDTWLPRPSDEHRGQRFEVGYNAQVFAVLLEQELLKAGCTVLYGTFAAAVIKKSEVIDSVIIENKDGRQAIKTHAVIDATGDADICAMAGAKTAIFPDGNPLAAWFYETAEGKTKRRMLGAADVLSANPFAESPRRIESKRYSGVDAAEVSEMTIASHKASLDEFFKIGNVSQSHSLTALAVIPQLRKTRRLVGNYEMNASLQHEYMSDSIGLIGDWRKAGPVYELSFGSLFSEAVPNLAVVGRCISVSNDMWDITRVIPPSVVTGQAAGTAFSLCNDLRTLDVGILQNTLHDDGVVIHEREL